MSNQQQEAASEVTVEHWVSDLSLNLARLDNIVKQVSEAVGAGNLDSALLVLGTQEGKIERFLSSYRGLAQKLEDEGASVDKALQRGREEQQ